MTSAKLLPVDQVEAATARAGASVEPRYLRQAEAKLRAEGLHRAKAYRIERRAPNRWWAAYSRRGRAWTAVFAGELPEDWRLLGTIDGWPVARKFESRG